MKEFFSACRPEGGNAIENESPGPKELETELKASRKSQTIIRMSTFRLVVMRGGGEPLNKKTHNNFFTGLSQEYPGTVPAFCENFRGFNLCISFFPQETCNTNNFDPHPFPEQSRKVVSVYCFLRALISALFV